MDGLDLSYGLIEEGLPRAAPEDLSPVVGEYPFDPKLKGVFLQNNNDRRGIVAAIRVDGASTARVDSLDRTASQPRWPLRFEARVAPGSQILLAPTEVTVAKRIITGSHVDIEVVVQRVTVEGAYYRDPPYPSDPAPECFIRVYTIPIINGDPIDDSLELMVNLHNSRGVTLSAEPRRGTPGRRRGTVFPGLNLMFDQCQGEQAWDVFDAKYFP